MNFLTDVCGFRELLKELKGMGVEAGKEAGEEEASDDSNINPHLPKGILQDRSA